MMSSENAKKTVTTVFRNYTTANIHDETATQPKGTDIYRHIQEYHMQLP